MGGTEEKVQMNLSGESRALLRIVENKTDICSRVESYSSQGQMIFVLETKVKRF